jgi:hypothetical protein
MEESKVTNHQLIDYIDQPRTTRDVRVLGACSCGWTTPAGNKREATQSWLRHMLTERKGNNGQ